MTTFLPKDLQADLHASQRREAARKSRIRIEIGGDSYKVLRLWETGFALDADTAPHLRGRADIFDGARHVSQCLIVASEEEAGEIRFEFKRNTATQAAAPLDFYRDEAAPVALLDRPEDL